MATRRASRVRAHAALATATALAVLTAGSAAAAAAPPGQPAALTTKALFAKVHRAYLHVPAVELSVVPHGSTLRFPRRFVLILRSGVVVAEEFTRSGKNRRTLVARRHHPTYARKAGARCWRRLPSSDPQTLADVRIPFPYTRVHIKALAPKRTAFGWTVISENRAEFWFLALQPRRPAHLLDKYHLPIKRFITYAVYARSHRLKSLFIQQPSQRPERRWPTATLRVSALTAAPRLPKPAPVC
jgi:hypothetical protein